MYLRFFVLCWLGVLLAAGTVSCAETTDSFEIREQDKLTAEEKRAITAHIRRFVLRSKKLKLNDADRHAIQRTEPQFQIHYEGYKRGSMSVRWKLPKYRVLLLQRSGDFLSSGKADWNLRLIKDNTVRNIPDNFFGAHGEDISIPH